MTQSARMILALHPALRADWLVLRRTGWAASAVLGTPALLLACCVAIACGDLYGGYGWCLAAGALLALGGSHAIAHARMLGTIERWRFGWCGALPTARGAMTWTLSVLTTAVLIVSLAFIIALLLAVSWHAPHHADLPYALAGMGLGVIIGTAIALVRVSRASVGRVAHADGIREPLLVLPWLNDRRLPHLVDWQRRAALVKWRRGGSFVLAAVVLAGVPDGPSIPVVVALVLLVLAWAWLAVVMRASADSTRAVMDLLGATPLDVHCARAASLRYPFVAALCALVPMIAGTLLTGRGIVALAWVACALAVSVWPLFRMLRVTTRPEPPV